MRDFLISDEGYEIRWRFCDMFNCDIRIDEPGLDVVMDYNGKTYTLSSETTAKEIKNIFLKSIETKSNLLLKINLKEKKYDKSVLY